MEILAPDERFYEIVRLDYQKELSNVKLKASESYWESLKPQTIQGHAIEGHCQFRKQDTLIRIIEKKTKHLFSVEEVERDLWTKKQEQRKREKSSGKEYSYKGSDRKYPNTTIYDVCEALQDDPFKVAKIRQDFIDGIIKFVHKIALKEPINNYTDSKKQPLCGIYDLPQKETGEDLKGFLNGVYFAYAMDNFNIWRKRVFEKHGIGMGGGEVYLGNLEEIFNSKTSLDKLSTEEHSDEDVYDLLSMGLLSEEGQMDKYHGSVYIRKKKGGGSIDDLAIIIAALMWGEHGGIGVMLNDAIDTLDKFVPYIVKNGQDELLGRKLVDLLPVLQRSLPGYKLPEDDLIVDMMSVIAGHNYTGHSHSSQRYLHQIDPQTKQTAFESHMNFALNKPYKQMFLFHPSLKESNKQLYKQFRERFRHTFPKMAELVDLLDYKVKEEDIKDSK